VGGGRGVRFKGVDFGGIVRGRRGLEMVVVMR
jgi:hypothetical protein